MPTWLHRSLLALGVVAGLGLAAIVWFRPDLVPEWTHLKRETPEHTAESGLFCDEHGVPEAYCTICHPELKDRLLLCDEHGGLPEAICTKCHPEVEGRYNLVMCPKGHGFPRDFCPDCGPQPGSTTAVLEPAPDDGWCALHNTPEELCELCPEGSTGMPAGTKCRQPLPLIKLSRPELASQIGLATTPAVEVRHAHELQANAETAFDANQFAEITPRVEGFLREIRSDLGTRVEAGQVLAVVDSAMVSAAKSQLISARAGLNLAKTSFDRITGLASRDAVPAKQEMEARTALNQAESESMNAAQALHNLGFDDADLERIVAEKETDGVLRIISPISGLVVERHAVRGEAVQPTTKLFSVADTSHMWLWVDVYEANVPVVARDQLIRFRILGADGTEFAGTITWVGAEVDPITRTTKIRAELDNHDGLLRANQFGQATIQVGAEHRAIQIPRDALQSYDKTNLVFLPMEPGVYRPQRVVVSEEESQPGTVEIAWGLQPGDQVVTRGAFLLKTELMKDSLGAGCCE